MSLFRIITILSVLASLFCARDAQSQDCVSSGLISPLGSDRSWIAIGSARNDVVFFNRTNTDPPLNRVAVMRPNAVGAFTQVQLISLGATGGSSDSVMSYNSGDAAADTFAVGHMGSNVISDFGTVKVFRRQSNGNYSLTATLYSPTPGQAFGRSVALNEVGDTLAVSAPQNPGRVYVYRRSTTGAWSLAATLTGTEFMFGWHISASQDRVAAWGMGANQLYSAYVWKRNGASYALERVFVAPSARPGDGWGEVILSEDRMVWHCRNHYEGQGNKTGSIIFSYRFSNGTWSASAQLDLPHWFDVPTVAFERGTLALGRLSSPPYNTGQVYGYQLSGNVQEWTQVFFGLLGNEGNEAGAYHLSMWGDKIVASDPQMTVNGNLYHGGGYVFDVAFDDCNGNSVRDECEILAGTQVDADGNGRPDSCIACLADINLDRIVSGPDLGLLLGEWGMTGQRPSDLNGDSVVNGSDLGLLLGAWGACP
jgi:hypothetical protein